MNGTEAIARRTGGHEAQLDEIQEDGSNLCLHFGVVDDARKSF